MTKKTTTRSDQFLDALKDAEHVLIVTHDNPDPDAMASGWALTVLIRQKLGATPRFIAGGGIVRAENVRMVQLLKPPIELVDCFKLRPESSIVLIDCHPLAANHLLGEESPEPVAVIDHHITGPAKRRFKHRDLRDNVSATATIAAQYLQEQKIEPSPDLATALLYAIRTDAQTIEPDFTRVDKKVLAWLTPFADLEKLSDIENAPLSKTYYGDLLLAMETTFLYDDAALCFLPTAEGPEIVGEVADLLVRCEEVNRVLCAAIIQSDVMLSVRTTKQGGDAAALVQKAVDGMGHAGGHANRAGGKISSLVKDGKMSNDLQNDLRKRWLRACNIKNTRGKRLVQKKKILHNL